jgi:hypothetical protein
MRIIEASVKLADVWDRIKNEGENAPGLVFQR